MTPAGEKSRLAAAILAGGKAKRLGGIAKGAIDVGGVSFAQRLIDQLAQVNVGDVRIVANDPSPYLGCGVEIIGDRRRGHGPLGGIEAALLELTGRADATVLVPCDTPGLTATELGRLIDAFAVADAPGVCARTGEFFWHPLCAVVHNDLAPQISAAIDAQTRSVQKLWRTLGVEPVDFDDDAPFVNINTPEDLADYEAGRR
jgi:molybdenum cofactor guanylyltransferase